MQRSGWEAYRAREFGAEPLVHRAVDVFHLCCSHVRRHAGNASRKSRPILLAASTEVDEDEERGEEESDFANRTSSPIASGSWDSSRLCGTMSSSGLLRNTCMQ